jgi:16S rRNA (cytidine1402-2'-O)-methyltransferase
MEENKNTGCLYIVATPVGNLEDISFRALRTLREADLIAAEDTRHTLKLLNHYEIKKSLISYYEHNKRERGNELILQLESGKNIALVTDAGTPGISDPGEDIVKLAIENDIPVVMVPGPTALIMGVVLSGLPCGRFCFEGFLPHRKKERIKRLESIRCEERTIVFYITPHRTIDELCDMLSVLGNRKSALCRELTKKHEEIIRGTLEQIIETLSSRESIKGEMKAKKHRNHCRKKNSCLCR